jgi:hypothetical protein
LKLLILKLIIKLKSENNLDIKVESELLCNLKIMYKLKIELEREKNLLAALLGYSLCTGVCCKITALGTF